MNRPVISLHPKFYMVVRALTRGVGPGRMSENHVRRWNTAPPPFVSRMHSEFRYLLVHSEQPLDPMGPNAGAETASLNHALYLAKAGCKVVLAATLSRPAPKDSPVEFWDLGPTYDVAAAVAKMESRGPYHLLAAGRAVALFFGRNSPNCGAKVLITHDRCAGDCGVKPHLLPHLVDSILCVSEAQRSKLAEEGAPAELMTVIHNGVDFSTFHPDTGSRHPRRLVFSGAIVPDKGLHVLLEAFMKLKPRYSDLTLEVFGSASLWARGEYLDIENLRRAIPGVTFHGKQPQSAIADGFRRAALCVIPSIWFDPYPLTSLEAQACGCPVAAFAVGGLPEGIKHGETGVIIKEIDPGHLADALDRLLSDPRKLEVMSRRAAESAAVEFRWELVVKRMIDICEGVTSRSGVLNSRKLPAPPWLSDVLG